MKKIIIASAAFLAIAGAAAAQEAPGFDAFNPYAQAAQSQDLTASHGISNNRGALVDAGVDATTNVNTTENYSGQ